MAEHLASERLAATPLTPAEEAHVVGCVACRAERRVKLASGGSADAGSGDVAPPLQGGRYRLRAVLGSGGMATVYRAFDTVLGLERAIKVLRPEVSVDAEARVRFTTEARTMARLQHPHIVTVYDVVEDGDRVFIVMELLGETLMTRITRRGPLAPGDAARLMADVLDVLQLAHDHGVVHRDVKPHNILLDATGSAKLGDFGIARVSDRSRVFTRPGALLGTLAYMAPEQGGDVDGRADVYAAGATLYVLLTGRQPPVGNGLDVWTEATAGLPPAFAAVIQRATRDDRAQRWATPREMATALRAMGKPVGGRRTGAWLAALALVVAALVGWRLAGEQRADPVSRAAAVLPPRQGDVGEAPAGGGEGASPRVLPVSLDVVLLPPGQEPGESDWQERGVPGVAKGHGTEHVWFRTTLENHDPAPRRVWLELTSPAIDRARLMADGEELGVAGVLVPRDRWPAATPNPTFPVDLGPGSTVRIVGEVSCENERSFEVHVIDDDALMPVLSARALFHGVYYGALAMLGLLALTLAVRLRERVFAAYGVYALSLVAWTTVLDGHFPLAWPTIAATAPRMMYWLPSAFTIVAMLCFVMWFVGESAPTARRALLGFLLATVPWSVIAASGLIPWRVVNEVGNVIVVLTATLIAATTGLASRRGVAGAGWIAFGWIGFAVIITTGMGCQVVGVRLPIGIYDLTRIAVAFEMLGSAFAIGARFQETRAQRDLASASALAARRLGRYLPKPLVERILASEDEAVVRSERVLVTVMCCDLPGFTDLSDRASPERVTGLLNEFLALAVPIVAQNSGTVDRMTGDGLVVLFGTPSSRPPLEQAQCALAAALSLYAAFGALGERWRAEGLEHDVRMRVGLHQDLATVGNFGTSELLTRTAIGGAVDLAARLKSACPPGHILASYPVVTQARGLPWGELRERTYDGIATAQRVAELDPARVTRARELVEAG